MKKCVLLIGLSCAMLSPIAAQTIHVVTEQTPYT